MGDDDRRALLTAALAFLQFSSHTPALRPLHAWLDSWHGVGLVVVGMERQGFKVSIRSVAVEGLAASFHGSPMRMASGKRAAARWTMTVTGLVALFLALVVVPAACKAGVVEELETVEASAPWMREFSRLPLSSPDVSGSAESWQHDLAFAPTLASVDEGARAAAPDWIGLARDTGLLLGYQSVATFGIIYALPEDISRWPETTATGFGASWVHNVQHPTFDHDAWWINYVMHPYFGAMYYIRARERGFGEFQSFLYSAFASTMYEFGVEAFFEKPSIQDLIVTPVAGALLGGFVLEPVRRHIRSKPTLDWYDHVGLVLTDPIGALNTIVERVLGIKSTFRIAPTLPILDRGLRGPGTLRERTGVGFQFSMSWP